jgi:hypothetical protein
MANVPRDSVPLHRRPVDPALRPGIGALHVWLLIEKDYPQAALERIVRHVAAEGTLEGAEDLDPEDRAEAEHVFTEALASVPFDDPAWDDPRVYLDVESILVAARGPDDVADRSIPAGEVLIPPELDDLDGESGDHPDPNGVS